MKKPSKSIEFINYKTDDELQIEGYVKSTVKTVVTWLFIVFSFGLLRLLFYWRPDWMLRLTHFRSSLKKCQKVLLKDRYNQLFVEQVHELNNLDINDILSLNKFTFDSFDLNENENLIPKIRFFINKKVKYYWCSNRGQFLTLKGLEENYSLNFFRRHLCLSEDEHSKKLLLYDKNSIRVNLNPILTLFFREVLSPFYIFQIFSVILWIFESYYLFAACIFIISVTSIIYSLYSIRKNERALRNMIHNTDELNVFRKKIVNDKIEILEERINSELIVPGDVIEIENLKTMQCDAVLLNGNVIVNESMLTGESIPITKTGIGFHLDLNEVDLSLKEHKKNIIFAGTQVIQTRFYSNEKIKAIVLRTGFNTSKGELIRTILFPKPSEFKFNTDLYKYIAALGLISVVGMIFTIYIKLSKKSPISEIILKSLDLVSIVVPPALQGALTACLLYAQNRLKKQKIYCISPNTINVCGSIDCFVFDKTGTLTEDDSDLKCIVPNINSKFGLEINKLNLVNDNRIIELMASCNSITFINGKLDGDPLDLKLFSFTNWTLIEPSPNEKTNFDMLMPTIVKPNSSNLNLYEIGIIKQFPFLSSLQRMGVVIRCLNRNKFEFYAKGSPESIIKMCKTETIPENFSFILNKYTRKGYRVLALAYRILDDSINLVKLEKMSRDCLETDLNFLGLVIMENRLKFETTAVINSLNSANIKTIMCTGDNLLTGISVSRDCNLISKKDKIVIINCSNENQEPRFILSGSDSDSEISNYRDYNEFSFAIDGHSFDILRNNYLDLYQDLIQHGSVYARMGPDQKQQLIEALQNQNKIVGMCGDGANDCGALKAANAGISLSSAEASIASPFTSKTPTIECVPTVIKEGRATLITSFGVVKFICMYSLTQFSSVILLYTDEKNLTDMQFLYIDMVLITFIAFFFSRNKPFDSLDKKSPSNKLIAWRPISSLIFHTFFLFLIQYFMLRFVEFQPWFEKIESQIKADYQTSAVFLVSTFQYLTEAIIFSKGLPYRRSIFSNKLLIMAISIAFCINLILCLTNIGFFINFFVLKSIPDLKFRFFILQIALIHFFVSFLFETFIFDNKN